MSHNQSPPSSPSHDGFSFLYGSPHSNQSLISHDPDHFFTLENDSNYTQPFETNLPSNTLNHWLPSSNTVCNIMSDIEEGVALAMNERVEPIDVQPSRTPIELSIAERYPQLTSKKIQKAAYNFGHAAIGNHMKKKVRDGDYDSFMRIKLGRDEDFIRSLRRNLRDISYHLKSDFKRVWKCKLSNKLANLEYNQNVVLRKITKQFFREDASNWIDNKTRREDYRALYGEILQTYRNGIKNVDQFSLREFSSKKRKKP